LLTAAIETCAWILDARELGSCSGYSVNWGRATAQGGA
jgi:hypothetical protein